MNKSPPTELFFITLPNETTLHTKDFKLEKYKKDGDSINLTFVRNDFEVDVTLNVIKQRYVSVDYKIKAVGNDRKIKKSLSCQPKNKRKRLMLTVALTAHQLSRIRSSCCRVNRL